MDSRPPLASVDSVRDELRRLGYLDHGLDRFVLSAAGSRSPVRAAVDAGARVGLLGGLLFGTVLTLAAAALDPRLRAEPRDLLVLALYATVLLGATAAVLAFLGGLVAAMLGRRLQRTPGPALSRNVGLAVAAAALVYMALWGRSHLLGAPWAIQAGALLLGALSCVALFRFASLAAVAVLSVGGLSERVPRARPAQRHLVPLVAGAFLILAGGIGVSTHLGDREGHDVPDFAVVPTGLRVRVLAIDGLEWRMAEKAMERGDMPRLARARAGGAHGPLATEPEEVPAIVWTTVATGRGPEAHGIQAAGNRRLAGMRTPVALETGAFTRALGSAAELLKVGRAQPATSVLRGAKTFWNVASEKGLRVGVVNWWATWPADEVDGYVVTDRAFFKLEKRGVFDRETHPAALFETLRPHLSPAGEPGRAQLIDSFSLETAIALSRQQPADVEAVYLPGLDIVVQQLLGDAPGADLASLAARLDAAIAYHRSLDALIGRFLDASAPQDVTLVVGDPGRLARRGGVPRQGILILSGAVIRQGPLAGATERDIAPTVLHLAGLPVSRELTGHALETALVPEFRARHPVRTVESYGRRRRERAAESAFDAEMVEELRSLGYIQ